MGSMFYVIVFVVFFVVLAAILAIRHHLGERLAKLEKIEQAKKEARNIAESNSGL